MSRVVTLGMSLAVAAGMGLLAARAARPEEKPVTPLQSDSASAVEIPPIDRQVPEKIETATFAVG